MAKDLGERNNVPITVQPLDVFTVHMLGLADLISKNRLTPGNAERELEKVWKLTNAVDDAFKKYTSRSRQ